MVPPTRARKTTSYAHDHSYVNHLITRNCAALSLSRGGNPRGGIDVSRGRRGVQCEGVLMTLSVDEC